MKIRPVFWVAVLLCFSIAVFCKLFLPYPPDIYLSVHRNQSGVFQDILEPLRIPIRAMIDRRVPSPWGQISKAILLGEQKGMDRAIRDSFSKSGTAHLLAISGGNITLVAFSAILLLRFFPIYRRMMLSVVIAFLVFYCFLTGASASIVRATIMVSIFLGGTILKREPEILTSLSWAAIIVLLFDPLQVFDIGFQLSFISVFMIAAVCGEWEDFEIELESDKLKKAWIYLQRALGVSLAAWVGVAPIIASAFSLVTPVTIIANLVLVPYFDLLQTAGFVFIIVGSLNHHLEEILGNAFALICYGSVRLSDAFVAMPFSYFKVRPPDGVDVCMFYVIAAAGIVWVNRKHNPNNAKVAG